MSSGKLVVGGEHRGTAWLASERFAVTAAHCLRPGETEGELYFGMNRCGIRVLDRDPKLDAALLEISATTMALPIALELTARPERHVQSGWRSVGFPEAMLPYFPDGFALDGNITQYPETSSALTSMPLMQLTCEQGPTKGNPAKLDRRGQRYPVFAGASGGPVCLDACAGRVVGIIRRATPLMAERTLAATPIDLIHARFTLLRESVVLHPWSLQIALQPTRDPRGELRPGSTHGLAAPTWTAPKNWNFWVSYNRNLDKTDIEAFLAEAELALEAGLDPAFQIEFPWIAKQLAFIHKHRVRPTAKQRLEVAQARGFVHEEEGHRASVSRCVRYLLLKSVPKQYGWGYLHYTRSAIICRSLFTGAYVWAKAPKVSFRMFSVKHDCSIHIELTEEQCWTLPHIQPAIGYLLSDQLRLYRYCILDLQSWFLDEIAIPAILAEFLIHKARNPFESMPEFALQDWFIRL